MLPMSTSSRVDKHAQWQRHDTMALAAVILQLWCPEPHGKSLKSYCCLMANSSDSPCQRVVRRAFEDK